MVVLNFRKPGANLTGQPDRYSRVGMRGAGITHQISATPDASNDEAIKAQQKINFIENSINVASDIASKKLGRQLNSGERAEIRRHAAAHSDPQGMLSAVLNNAEIIAEGTKDDFQKMLAAANIDPATYHTLAANFPIGSLGALIALAAALKSAQARGISVADFVAGNGRVDSLADGWSAAATRNYTGSSGSPDVMIDGRSYNIAPNSAGVVVLNPTVYQRALSREYNQNGQSNIQTASTVATILAGREKLVGRDLLDRTREVGHDTKERLHLDIKKYAPDVAYIGKPITNDIITSNDYLRASLEAAKAGNMEESKRLYELHQKSLAEGRGKALASGDPKVVQKTDVVAGGATAQSFKEFLDKHPNLTPEQRAAAELAHKKGLTPEQHTNLTALIAKSAKGPLAPADAAQLSAAGLAPADKKEPANDTLKTLEEINAVLKKGDQLSPELQAKLAALNIKDVTAEQIAKMQGNELDRLDLAGIVDKRIQAEAAKATPANGTTAAAADPKAATPDPKPAETKAAAPDPEAATPDPKAATPDPKAAETKAAPVEQKKTVVANTGPK